MLIYRRIEKSINNKPTIVNFVTIDAITAINASKNLHLQIPLRVPLLVKIENGPTWRNFVIPMAPVITDIAKVAKNQGIPPKPP